MKADKLQQDELIVVVWSDIKSVANWNTPEEIDTAKCPECKTAGFFHHIKDGDLIIKPTVAEDKEADYAVIPIGCIKRIWLQAINKEYKPEIKKIKGKYNIYVRKNG